MYELIKDYIYERFLANSVKKNYLNGSRNALKRRSSNFFLDLFHILQGIRGSMASIFL